MGIFSGIVGGDSPTVAVAKQSSPSYSPRCRAISVKLSPTPSSSAISVEPYPHPLVVAGFTCKSRW
ncbi:hypothetical protein U1Q18_013966 [Sarracenia purpurea var. burkii]